MLMPLIPDISIETIIYKDFLLQKEISACSVVSPFEAVVSCKDAKTRKSGNDHVTGTTI